MLVLQVAGGIVLVLAILLSPNFAHTKNTRTKGYIKKSGTYVAPSNKTSPNKTKLDNYSTKGNVNPYTGKKGYKK